jgi:NAD(P)H-nitrite reductase large subunit
VIVCHCRAVGHQRVLGAIAEGAGTVDDVSSMCGAGSVCGGCRPTIEAMLANPARSVAVPAVRGSRRSRVMVAAATA